MNKRPLIGVGCIVVKDNRVLLGKRKGGLGDGTWGLVGGHLEFGESPEQCAKREAQEEAGILIENVRFLNITNDFYENENKHYVTIFMVADLFEGEARSMEPDRFHEWKWCSWDDLPIPLLDPLMQLKNKGITPFPKEKNVQKGLYKHYKGHLYEVLGSANHSESLEELVVYKSLTDNKIWVRPREMFEQKVKVGDAEVARFVLISPLEK